MSTVTQLQSSTPEHFDVLIVGAGPVGLTLANLLGAEGLRVFLAEQNPDTVPEPRAIAIDGDGLATGERKKAAVKKAA